MHKYCTHLLTSTISEPEPVKEAPAPVVKEEKKKESASPFALFQQPAAKKPVAPPRVEAPKVPPSTDIDMAPNAMTEALNSFFGGSVSAEPVAKVEKTPEPVQEVSKPKPQPFSLFGSAPASPKAPVAPKPAPVAPVRKPAPTLSLFGGASPKAAPKTPPPAPVSKPAATKGTGTFSIFSSPPAVKVEPAPTPVVEKKSPPPAFGGFFGGSPAPKPATKAPSQPIKPAEKAPVKGTGTFSLFGGASSTPSKQSTPVATPPVVQKQAPVRKPASTGGVAGIGGFGSFSAPKKTVKAQPVKPQGTRPVRAGTISISSAPKKPAEKPAAPAKKSPTFSLFGGASPSKPVVTPEPAKPVAKKASGGFSFGIGAPKKEAPKVEVEAPKTAKKSPTFSLFGGGASPSKPIVTPEPAKPVAKKASGGFSFGGAPKKAAPVADNIPIVGKFRQNRDGSITGIVRNSKNFSNGTEITTSPVGRGAKAGDVVTTSSGSKYRLE